MKKAKKYLAHADAGRDCVSFIFYSTHRANSAENIADAKRAYIKKNGVLPKIKRTVLFEL